MTDETGSQVVTPDEARSLLRTYERLFAAGAVEEILAGFAEDAIVQYADLPPMQGKTELEAFLRARFARQRNYRLSKTLEAVSGNVVAGSWTGEWEDATTGQRMLGRGSEFLTLSGGLCTRWQATFNMWAAGSGSSLPLLAGGGRTALAIRNVAGEGLGGFAALLAARGYAVSYADAATSALDAVDPTAADLLVLLGGPISVNDTVDFPFLNAELKLIEARLKLGLPTLGICLGAQLIAKACGAHVAPMTQPAIRWGEVALTAAGQASPLRHLAGIPVLQWHGEGFDLPAGGTVLAATQNCPHQAVALGDTALALQFHPEVTAADIETWMATYPGELRQATSAAQLRADTAHCVEAALAGGSRVLADWLDRAEATGMTARAAE